MIEKMTQQTTTRASTSKKRVAPDIKDWDLDYKAHVHAGLDASNFRGIQWLHSSMQNFMNICDLNQAPLKSVIRSIYRVRAMDVDNEGNELDDGSIKEWLTYTITYSGKDFWNRKCVSPEIVMGLYMIPTFDVQTDWKISDGGTPEATEQSIPGEPRWKYTIPFSKANVDKILKENNNFERKDEIDYGCKFRVNRMLSAGGERCGDYSYEQFVNSDFVHMQYLANRIGGPKGDHNLGRIDPSKVQNSCSCVDCQKASKKKEDKTGKGII